jgi:serine/threonine-protein kinase SRK2
MDEIEQMRAVLESQPNFHDVAFVGSGSFGKVFRANLIQRGVPSGQIALKVLHRDMAENAHVQREILIHNKLMHPHIIQFKRLLVFDDYICIAMEYADQGSLHHDFTTVRQGEYTDQEIRKLFQQLMLAVDYCHRKGVADRDIKLENVLLRQDPSTGEPLLKLADFGYSKNVDQSAARTQVEPCSQLPRPHGSLDRHAA